VHSPPGGDDDPLSSVPRSAYHSQAHIRSGPLRLPGGLPADLRYRYRPAKPSSRGRTAERRSFQAGVALVVAASASLPHQTALGRFSTRFVRNTRTRPEVRVALETPGFLEDLAALLFCARRIPRQLQLLFWWQLCAFPLALRGNLNEGDSRPSLLSQRTVTRPPLQPGSRESLPVAEINTLTLYI